MISVVRGPVFSFILTGKNETIRCCTSDGKYLTPDATHPLCFPIDVGRTNEFYSRFGVSCLEFVRSVVAPRDDCSFGYAEQVRLVVAFSWIYYYSRGVSCS